VATLRAVLSDAEGNPVAGQPITFKVGSQTVSASTGADGVALASLVVAQAVGTTQVQLSFAGTDNYEPASGTKLFTVLNTPPKLTDAPTVTAGQGGATTLAAGFSDPDISQDHQASIDWGDGTSQPVTVTENEGEGYYGLSVPHTYAYDGTYTATITMTDSAGGTANTSAVFTVRSIPPTATLQRFGFHAQPTKLVLTFNEPIDASSASNLANYRLVPSGPRGKVAARAKPIRLSAALYDEATHTVTLLPRTRLPLRNNYRLIVSGLPVGGVQDRAGVMLDGNRDGTPGDSMNVHFNRKLLAGRAADWPIGGTKRIAVHPVKPDKAHAAKAVVPHALAVGAHLAKKLARDHSCQYIQGRNHWCRFNECIEN
jgi:hypothetical protein